MRKIKGFTPFLGLVFTQVAAAAGMMALLQLLLFRELPASEFSWFRYVLELIVLLPFILVPTPAGHFSDKYPKEKVLRVTSLVALPMTVLVAVSFYLGSWPVVFASTLLLFSVYAFHSPAKYGYLRELVGVRYLSVGTAFLTVFSICGFIVVAVGISYAFQALIPVGIVDTTEIMNRVFPLSLGVFGLGLISFIFAMALPEIGCYDPELKFQWEKYFQLSFATRKLRKLWQNQSLRQSIIGLSMFWVIVQMIVLVFQERYETGGHAGMIFGSAVLLSAVGLIFGCIYASRMSRAFIETGLIPMGTAGASVCIFLIPVFVDYPVVSTILLGALGFFGGVFVVPMTASLLYQTKPRSAGHVVSFNNAVQHTVLLVFYAVTILSIRGLNFTTGKLFFLLGLICLVGTIWAIAALPQSLLRQFLKGILSNRYRLDVQGAQNVPWEGPVLLLGNHISYIDWALLQMACPRPLRIVVRRQTFQKWYIRLLLNHMNVIILDPNDTKPAMQLAREALLRREAVAMFPEIALSQTGNVNKFRLNYSSVIPDVEGLILVPFYVQGLWGSAYSLASARYQENVRRSGARSVTVAFGTPLPPETLPVVVKNRVQELSIVAWTSYIRTLRPLAQSWLRTALRVQSSPSVFSPDGNHLSGTALVAAALTFGNKFDKICANEQNVGILLPPSGPGIIVNLALLLKGRTVVNLNYSSSAETMDICCERAEIKTIITAHIFIDKMKARGLRLEILEAHYHVIYMEDLKKEVSKFSLLRNFARARILPAWWIEFWDFKKVTLDDVAAILFSSGSEGTPKGVELTHFNFMGNIKQCESVLNPTSDDVMLGILPLFHAFGFSITTMMCLVEGIPLVAYADPTDAKTIGRLCAEFKVTVMVGTGTFLRMYAMSRYVHPLMFAHLRAVWAGAEKIRDEVRSLYRTKFQKEIYEGFGTTETTPVAAVNAVDTLLDDFQTVQQGNKPGTVGTPLPGTQFRIVNPETMEELPIGEDGLILIGGAQIMKCYLKEPERTASVIAVIDGKRWYKSGDKGHVDEDGFVTIVDRYSRFAKLGGEMVSLGAVEWKISESHIMEDTDDFCAVAVPDVTKGERVVLLYHGDLDVEEIKVRLRSIKMEPLMIPSFILKVDSIPKLGSGKTDVMTAKDVAQELMESGNK